jgi:hypothetical protein
LKGTNMKMKMITKLTGVFLVSVGLLGASLVDGAEMIEPAAPESAAGASSGGATHTHSSLAQQATNPVAPLIQLQLQNLFIPDSHNADGYSNQLIVQPVIPIAKQEWLPDFLPRSILRPTIPIFAALSGELIAGSRSGGIAATSAWCDAWK